MHDKFLKDLLKLIQQGAKDYDLEFYKKNSSFNQFDFLDAKEQDFYEGSLADLNYIRLEMRQMLYRIFIVSVFILIEKRLSDFCNVLQKNKKQIFSYKDLGRSNIKAMTTYIQKLTGENLLVELKIAEQLSIFTAVRNLIVHKNGYVDEDTKNKLKKYSEESPHCFKFSKDDEIIFDNDRYLVDVMNIGIEIDKKIRSKEIKLIN
ncbi:MAG: hypothetical protein AAB378_03370 [Patescibacteria group bacterium]